jgi:hypothetical protein
MSDFGPCGPAALALATRGRLQHVVTLLVWGDDVG